MKNPSYHENHYQESSTASSNPDSDEQLNWLQRIGNSPMPSLAYRVAMGTIASSTALVVSQNLPLLDLADKLRSDNYYPAAPFGCEDYVDMDRDLTIRIEPEQGSKRIIADFNEAQKAINDGDTHFKYAPDQTDVRSRVERFNIWDVNVLESYRQFKGLFDHPIDSFTMPTSNLKVNLYSSRSFQVPPIDEARFDELFHAGFDSELAPSDPHYSETLTCLQKGFGFPDVDTGTELDVYFMPELGYCFFGLRIVEEASLEHDQECDARGATPPKIEATVAWWSYVFEDTMILTFPEQESAAQTARSMNRIIAHEALHYWLNQTDRVMEYSPEERMVDAIVEHMQLANVAKIITGPPAIHYPQVAPE